MTGRNRSEAALSAVYSSSDNAISAAATLLSIGVAAQVGGELGRLLTEAARSAFISGADLGLLTGAAIVLAGSVLALVTVPPGRA